MAAGIALNEKSTRLRAIGAGVKGAGNLVAEDDAPHGRGNNTIELEVVEFSRESAAKLLGVAGMLEHLGALNVRGAV